MIVGGGYSGVETAGEILDRLQAARRYYRILDTSDLQVTLVEEVGFEVTECQRPILWTDQLSADDHFGEGPFLYGIARQVTVMAKTPAKLLVFASNEFRSILKNFTTLQQALSYTALRSILEENLSPSRWSERLLATSVSHVMRKPVVCLPESASIKDAVNTLTESRQEILPVVDSDRKMTAVITEVDIFRNGTRIWNTGLFRNSTTAIKMEFRENGLTGFVPACRP